jgi:membrane protease YdiL (CAAX protease family)
MNTLKLTCLLQEIKAVRILQNAADRVRGQSWQIFLLKMTFASFAIKMPFFILLSILGLGDGPTTTDVAMAQLSTPLVILAVALIWAPIFDTCVFQTLPIEILNKLTGGKTAAIIGSAVFFGAAHYPDAQWLGSLLTFAPGLIFAWSYQVWREKSFMKAVGMTSGIHFMHNLICLGLYQIAQLLK